MPEVKRSHGGARKNSGPKKGEPWTRMSIPNSLVDQVKALISVHKRKENPVDPEIVAEEIAHLYRFCRYNHLEIMGGQVRALGYQCRVEIVDQASQLDPVDYSSIISSMERVK